MKTNYVCGFLFQDSGSSVVLIEKEKPCWQKGKFNGVGGKIERSETPEQAMAREFAEETGLIIPESAWTPFAHLEFADGIVIFFRCLDPKNKFGRVRQPTDEVTFNFPVSLIQKSSQVIPNLKWLIPLAIHDGIFLKGTQI